MKASEFITSDFSFLQEYYDPQNNTTSNILSIYEKTKLLGLRMSQLANGSPTVLSMNVLPTDNVTIRTIAEKELYTKVLPFIIVRRLPNDNIEYWNLSDMIII